MATDITAIIPAPAVPAERIDPLAASLVGLVHLAEALVAAVEIISVTVGEKVEPAAILVRKEEEKDTISEKRLIRGGVGDLLAAALPAALVTGPTPALAAVGQEKITTAGSLVTGTKITIEPEISPVVS